MNGEDAQSQQVSIAERQQQLQDGLDTFDEPTQLQAFLDALTEISAIAKSDSIGHELVTSLCRKLKLMLWKRTGGSEDTEAIYALCKTIATASLDAEVRRHVRNEGGLKTLVELLSIDTPEALIEASSHALMNLAVDAINKDALRACGLLQQMKRIFEADKDVRTSRYVLGLLINCMANNIANSLSLVDCGFVPLLETCLKEGISDQVSSARLQLLLNTFYFFMTPYTTGPIKKQTTEDVSLYELLKKENTEEQELLNLAFQRWMSSQEAHANIFKMGLVGDAAVILKNKFKSKS